MKNLICYCSWFGLVIFLFAVYGPAPIHAQTGSEIVISGTVADAETGESLAGVSISVKDRVVGAVSRNDGSFRLTVRGNPPVTLIVTYLGYRMQEIEVTQNELSGLDIELMEERVIFGSGMVVSASRVEESSLRSPVSIEKMDALTIRNTASPNFYDAIADLQGVQFTTSGLTFKSVNTRGFATIANTRFVQMIDGMDNAPPGLNFPAGNLIGISELDVESIELVPGAASALYGPNAFNGILIINSKDPFLHQGLSVLVRSGATSQRSIPDPAGENLTYEFGFRYAGQVNDRFAYKVNASVMQGTDWHATDYTDVDNHPLNLDRPRDRTNPSYNGLNVYGDEVATTLNLDQLSGQPAGTFGNIHVSRTGYNEVDLIDYNASSHKFDASLHYRLTDNLEAMYQYRLGTGTGIYQGFSRYSLENITLQYHKIELKGSNFFLRGYGSFENAGDSYDSRFLAWNINRSWKPDQQWFQEYAGTYIGARMQGINQVAAHAAARNAADTGRLEPGTEEFNEVRDEIRSLADLATGAKFIDKSNFLHLEGNYDLRSFVDFVDLQVGGNVRQYNLNSEGTLFNDEAGSIGILEWGAYTQASRGLISDRLRLTGSVRVDQNTNFDPQVSPRASLVYAIDDRGNHNIRTSFQTGFRNPDTQSQYIGLDLGPALLIGGTRDNVENFSRNTFLQNGQPATVTGMDAYNNAYTVSSMQQFAATGDPGALVIAQTDFVAPEQIQSVEVGYKGLWSDRLYVDMTYYYNMYSGFQIGRNVGVIPSGSGSVENITGVMALANGEYKIFQLYTNTDEDVFSQGIGINLNYALPRGYTIGGNYHYADFSLDDESSDFQAGFNTPKYRLGLNFGNRSIIDNLGFQLSYRWSDAYHWQSTFGVGTVESHMSTDLQITYTLPSINSSIKIGGANIFNQSYNTAYGAPQVGGQYYVTFRYDSIFQR